MGEVQAEVEIGRIRKQLSQLGEDKKINRNIKIFTRLLVLVLFSVMIYLLIQQVTQQVSSVNKGNLQKRVMKEVNSMMPMISKEMTGIARIVYPVYLEEIQKQIEQRESRFMKLLQNESHVFLRVADHDISKGLEENYPLLLEKQKQHLYEAFPEMKDKEKVNKAIDNIIANGGPKLQQILNDKFHKHENILFTMHHKLNKLEDKRLQNDKYLAYKTLGVTMELFGKKLQNIEEEVE